jgi:hypothetical protein
MRQFVGGVEVSIVETQRALAEEVVGANLLPLARCQRTTSKTKKARETTGESSAVMTG